MKLIMEIYSEGKGSSPKYQTRVMTPLIFNVAVLITVVKKIIQPQNDLKLRCCKLVHLSLLALDICVGQT